MKAGCHSWLFAADAPAGEAGYVRGLWMMGRIYVLSSMIFSVAPGHGGISNRITVGSLSAITVLVFNLCWSLSLVLRRGRLRLNNEDQADRLILVWLKRSRKAMIEKARAESCKVGLSNPIPCES